MIAELGPSVLNRGGGLAHMENNRIGVHSCFTTSLRDLAWHIRGLIAA